MFVTYATVAAVGEVVAVGCLGTEFFNPVHFALVEHFDGANFEDFDRETFPSVLGDSGVDTGSAAFACGDVFVNALSQWLARLSDVRLAVDETRDFVNGAHGDAV